MTNSTISKEEHKMYAEMATSLRQFNKETEDFWQAHAERLREIERKFGIRK